MNFRNIAEEYFYYLNSIKWDDDLYVKGISEGKSKFLANLIIADSGYSLANRHLSSDYVSKMALKKIDNGDRGGLVFEHMIPKRKYIQKDCEELARNGTLTVSFIEGLLRKYYVTATITKEEDRALSAQSMPEDWDEVDIFRRYDDANIDLKEW